MFDKVTLKLNVDPLILGALKKILQVRMCQLTVLCQNQSLEKSSLYASRME